MYAASSLTDVLPKVDPAERYSFGGSNTLAAQITQGAPADIFASANLTLPEQLYAKGLVTRPYVLTHNTLVLIVPRANPARVHSVTDLRKPDIKLVIAGPAVPVGAYTLQVLKTMGMTDVLDNVVSRESGRPRRACESGARGGRRGVRLRNGRTHRAGKGDGAAPPRLGAAERCVRDRGREREQASSRGGRVSEDAAREARADDVPRVWVPAAAHTGMRRVAFFAVVFAATLTTLGFPRPPDGGDLHARLACHASVQLGNPVVDDALVVSAKTTLVAQALVLLLGTPTAYLLATRRFRGRSLVVTAIELPLVLPPAVAGIGLLVTFGRVGLLHTSIPFTQTAVTLAVAFVSGPLYVRAAIAAFEAVDPTLVDAARTLGAGPARTFFRVALPLAGGGLAAGEALAFARGLGEFGATIMFAGSLQRVTQTLPLAIYAEFDVNFDVTLAISGVLVLISAAVLIALKLATSWTLSLQTSGFRFAPSTSS